MSVAETSTAVGPSSQSRSRSSAETSTGAQASASGSAQTTRSSELGSRHASICAVTPSARRDERVELLAFSVERVGEVAERVDQDERRLGRRLPQPPATRRRRDGAQQPLAAALDPVERAGGNGLLRLAARALDVEGEPPEPGARDAAAEPRCGRFLEPVRLVEDHRVVLGQHAAAGGEVREIQRVVRDHEVGLRGALAGRLGEAAGDERAAAAGTAICADRQLGPQRLGRLERELGPVTGLGLVEPALHRLPRAPVAPFGEQEGLEALKLAPAEVVLAALQHDHVDLAADRRRGDRDVLVQELLLQRLRRGRDDHALARLERRDQVGEALADAGARLGDEMLAGREGELDRAGERSLLRPRLVVGERARQRAAGAEDVVHFEANPTRANGCSPRNCAATGTSAARKSRRLRGSTAALA